MRNLKYKLNGCIVILGRHIPIPKQCQRKVKGMYKERVVNVCLHFTCRDKGKILAFIIPRTLYGILKKTNKGLS